MQLTLLSDILLSKDKVRGVYIELKEDEAQDKKGRRKVMMKHTKL